jgi:hypothetical protein
MSLIDTRVLLKGIADLLAGLRRVVPGDPDPVELPVFEVVAFYDAPRLLEALEDLVEFSGRVALVVPGPETYEASLQDDGVLVKRTLEVDVLISGRDFDPTDDVPAYFGLLRSGADWVLNGEDSGILGMKDAVVAGLSGRVLGDSGVCFVPVAGAPFSVEGGSGVRKAFSLTFRSDFEHGVFPAL